MMLRVIALLVLITAPSICSAEETNENVDQGDDPQQDGPQVEARSDKSKRSYCNPWEPWCAGGGVIQTGINNYGGAGYYGGCNPWDPWCGGGGVYGGNFGAGHSGHRGKGGGYEEVSHIKTIGIKTIPIKGYTTEKVIKHVAKPVVDYIPKTIIEYVPVEQRRIIKKPVQRIVKQPVVRYVHHPLIQHIKKPFVTYHKKPVYRKYQKTHQPGKCYK